MDARLVQKQLESSMGGGGAVESSLRLTHDACGEPADLALKSAPQSPNPAPRKKVEVAWWR